MLKIGIFFSRSSLSYQMSKILD